MSSRTYASRHVHTTSCVKTNQTMNYRHQLPALNSLLNLALAAILIAAPPLLQVNLARADEVFTGLAKLSCEAILCLATGSPPNECSPSLTHYFDIDFDDFGDTIDARVNFLNLCPVSAQTPQMQSLVQAIAHGAGRCDAASLNATLLSYTGGVIGGFGAGCISSTKPSYCSVYESHEYTDLGQGAHYVIDPPQPSGFWPFQGIGNGYGGISSIGIGGNYSTPTTCGHWVN